MTLRQYLPIAALLLAGSMAVAFAVPAAAGQPSTSSGNRTVHFAGVTVDVPSDWPVVDVDGVPGCVRYDRHAVYLGSPTESTCPAHLVGRTATVQILRSGTVSSSTQSAPTVHEDSAGDVTVGSGPVPRVIVTGGSAETALVDSIAATASIDGATVGARAVADAQQALAAPLSPSFAAVAPSGSSAQVVAPDAVPPSPTLTGKAFDTCSAPSLSALDAWAGSPYQAIGVYVGGINRACTNLTASWVSSATSRGWQLIPIYVGLQAPCSGIGSLISTNTTTAAQQGTAAAKDAAKQMAALGLGTAGNPVYLDMESWDNTNTKCTAPTMAFTNAWTIGLHAAGYRSGFYSSASTGITALVAAVKAKTVQAPDAVWFARWDGNAETATDEAIPDSWWVNHQRLKQYTGGHDETYGGVTINIDSDAVDGPVTAAHVAMATTGLRSAVPGKKYTLTLRARGGTAPYTYSVTHGSLPAGLTLSTSSGQISGTATRMAAPTQISITVTDAQHQTASRTYSMAVTFTDVPTTSTFFGDIAWLSNEGITQGNGDGTFGPTDQVLRQEMAAFLYRDAHDGANAGPCTGTPPFPDVAKTSTFCGDIAWLSDKGITQGNGNGTFGPTNPVLRQEMAAFLHRLSQLPS